MNYEEITTCRFLDQIKELDSVESFSKADGYVVKKLDDNKLLLILE